MKKERTELDSVISRTSCVSSFDYLVTSKIPQKTYWPGIAFVPLIIKGTEILRGLAFCLKDSVFET